MVSVIFIRFLKNIPHQYYFVPSGSYFTRYVENVSSFKVRPDFLENLFFPPSTSFKLKKIDKNIRKSESLNIFKKVF